MDGVGRGSAAASTRDPQRNPLLVPRVYVLILRGGENLLKKLSDFAILAKIQSGSVFVCVGDLESVKLSNGVTTQKLKGPRMICSASGNVSMYGSKMVVSVVNSKGLSAVGELVSGTVVKGGSVEVGLLDVPTLSMKRESLKGGHSQLVLDDPAITWVPVANSSIAAAPLYQSAPNVEHVEKARENLHYNPEKEVPGVGIWPSMFNLLQAPHDHSSEKLVDASKPATTDSDRPPVVLSGEELLGRRLLLSESDGHTSSVRSIHLSPATGQAGPTGGSETSEGEDSSSAEASDDDDDDASSEQSCNLEELCSSEQSVPFETQPGTREVHETGGQRLEVSLGFIAAPSQHDQPGRTLAPGRPDVGLC